MPLSSIYGSTSMAQSAPYAEATALRLIVRFCKTRTRQLFHALFWKIKSNKTLISSFSHCHFGNFKSCCPCEELGAMLLRAFQRGSVLFAILSKLVYAQFNATGSLYNPSPNDPDNLLLTYFPPGMFLGAGIDVTGVQLLDVNNVC